MPAWRDPLLPEIEIPIDLKNRWFRLGSARFQLLPKQYEFLRAPEEFVGFISGVGGGKTRVGAIKSAFLSMIPENRGVVGQESLPDLEDTTKRDLLDFLREAELLKEAPNSKNKRALVYCVDPATQESLGYTSEISFQHLDDPDHLRGRHLGWFWIDEISNLKNQRPMNILTGRLRLPAAKGRYKGLGTGNPRGRNWVFDFFFNPEILEELVCHKPGCEFCPTEWQRCNARLRRKRRGIHSTSYENYLLPPDYVENMAASYTADQLRIEVEARFDVYEGQAFREFDYDLHVIVPPPQWENGIPPREWVRLLAVDVGGATPWAFEWSAIDPYGNVVFYDELYRATTDVDSLVYEALPKMKDADRKDYEWRAKVIDYENRIAAEDLSKRGITLTNAIKHAKIASVNRLSSYLHPNSRHHFPDWHPRAGQPGSPRLFILPACRFLIREIPQQRWKEDPSNQSKDELDRGPLHNAVDAALYTVRVLPEPSTLKPSRVDMNAGHLSKMSQMYWEDVKRRQQERENAQRKPYRIHRMRMDMLE